MTFNNKEYLNNCLKDMRATLQHLVQDAVEKDQPLDSPIIKMQEERILAFVKQIKNMSYPSPTITSHSFVAFSGIS